MLTTKKMRAVLNYALVAQVIFALVFPTLASANAAQPNQLKTLKPSLTEMRRLMLPTGASDATRTPREAYARQAAEGGDPSGEAPLAPTTLAVSILSTPYATRDSNPQPGEELPRVYVVEAAVTNTGAVTATNVIVTLDYQPDPVNNWVLVVGEDPERTVDELAPGETYYAYWLARYSTVIGASHQYTVMASADNAALVSTSDNYYGNPAPGKTVMTRSTLSTGNSGVTLASAQVIVGVAFTVTVAYDLGSNPLATAFSPVGNTDFKPGAYRLLATSVRFYNDAQTQELVVADRLYFDKNAAPILPAFADNAEATYTFIALTPENTRLCSYTAVRYSSNSKYDQFYCDASKGTVVSIEGTLGISLTKQASALDIQQGQTLTYTVQYTNNSTYPLSYVWFWDDVNTAIGSIITDSIAPPSDPGETSSDRVAWYFDTIPQAGSPGSTGTLTFSLSIDGNGVDLADGTLLVNDAFFGINQGSLPNQSALTSTYTTAVQAPAIAISKSDGLTTVEQGELMTYTLQIVNSGSVAATGVVISDVLPAEVTLVGASVPPADSQVGQTLVWSSLGPIPPGGGSLTIEIPVQVNYGVPNGTVLVNTMSARYANPAGYVYDLKTAQDTTTVNAPILSISKSDYPDPVLTGNVITYTLSYANAGPGQATEVVISDVVPLSTTYQSCSGGLACGMAGGVVSWTIGTIAGYGSGSVSFAVLVSDTLETGDLIHNDDYGLTSAQTGYIAGAPITTLVNRSAAFVDGYTFVDANGDGMFNLGESTLSGITVTLALATEPVTTTDAGGYYWFRVETEASVSVSAALPAGYFRTTPGTVFTDTVLGITQTVNFGYAEITSTFGVIYGTVYDDLDHDGVRELGEMGLANVTVSSAEAFTPSVTTDEYGGYTLRYDVPGTVTVTETNPPYYVSTTPDVVTTDVITGSSNASPLDYGDFLGIKILGQVFEDADVDGAKDAGEGGVAGAVVAANGDSVTTGGTGEYTLFAPLYDSNPVLVIETDPAGYVSTNAIPGVGMSRVDANTLRIDSPISGTVYSGSYFGDVLASNAITISGYVWNDNGAGGGGLANGLRDGTEPGLAGAVVQLSSGLTQTTGADGLFLLYAPPGQVITVTEINPGGYVSTNAIPGNDATKIDFDTLRVNSLPGGSTSAGNLFGDVMAGSVATIPGYVFDDVNENGVMDGGELGMSGVTVTLEIQNGNTIFVQTASDGFYQFAVAPGTNVRISSFGPGGFYYPTTPESYLLSPPGPGVQPPVNFGYSDDNDVSVIFGIVYDDNNSNGEQDWGELGLPGAVITLTNGGPPITTTTSGNGLITGTFTFPVTQSDIYSVIEKNPPGYRSTTPDRLTFVVDLGSSYRVEFGDTNNPNTSSIYGTVFDDFNGDGVRDLNEPGLGGVVISITVGGGTGVITTTTKAYGSYTYGFEVEEEGYHTISEQDPALPGYHSTTPDAVNVFMELGHSYVVNFGDTDNNTFSNIIGTVFNDDSGDGVQDPLELGIPDVLVSLSNGMSTTTNQNGGYTFVVTNTGFIQVIETDPDGFHSTTPNTVTLNVATLGTTYVVDFGDSDNPFASSLFGTVFYDGNVNGGRDWAELGIAGVEVWLNTAPVPYTTNEWGQWTFLIDIMGTYTVTEVDLLGYLSTNAIPADPAVTKIDVNTLRAAIDTLGVDLGDNLFGDVLATDAITISGYVFEDLDGNGARDGAEPGLEGAIISLSSGLMQTTGADGAFLLYGPPGGAITVTESNPAGYYSIGAVAGNNAQVVNPDVIVVEALTGGQTSSGNLFADVRGTTLAVAKLAEDVNGPPLVVSDTIRYTWLVTNTGVFTAFNVTVTDDLPDGVTYVDAQADMGSIMGTDLLVWTVPSLLPAETATAWITVTINADQVGQTITNTGSITATNLITPPVPPPPVCPDGSYPVDGVCPVTPGASTDLTVGKTASSPTVVAGTELTYTVQVTNLGPSDATGVVVTDTLPAEVTVVLSTTSQGSFDELTGVWSVGNLADGASATLEIVVLVSPDATGTLLNSVEVAGGEYDPDGENNTDQVQTSVGSEADLAINKSDDPGTVVAGATLTYTLTFDNYGPSDAQDVYITDTLPAEVTFGGMVSVGSPFAFVGQSGQELVWSATTLAAEATGTIVFTVTVGPDVPDGTTIYNDVEIAANTPDPDLENNTASEPTDVTAQADLGIAKSDSLDPVSAGTVLTYTLTFNNYGSSDTQMVYITDTLPVEVTFGGMVSVDSPFSFVGQSGQELVWSATALAADDTGTIVFTVTVGADVPEGSTITNTVVITSSTADGNLENNADSEPTLITTGADLRITKSDDPEPAVAGGVLTYTLNFRNNGPADAQGVYITDTLPVEVTFGGIVSVDLPFSFVGQSGQDLVWSATTLTADDSGTIVFTVTVKPDVPDNSTITNQVTVASSTADGNMGNNADSEPTLITTEADLGITKSDDPNPVAAGAVLTYTLTFNNAGPSDAQAVYITDTLPAEVVFGGMVSVDSPFTFEGQSGQELVWSATTLAAEATGTIVFTVTVGADVPDGTTITNTVEIASSTSDGNLEDNTDSEPTSVTTQADLAISKSDDHDPVVAGTPLTYTLTFNNYGPSDAQAVYITDTLPVEVTFGGIVSVDLPFSFVGQSGQDLVWSATTLAAEATGTIVFTVTVMPDVPEGTTFYNDVEIASNTPDPDLENNTASEPTEVSAQADLGIAKSDDPDPVAAGGVLTYTLTFDNAGPADAQDVYITDTLPVEVTFGGIVSVDPPFSFVGQIGQELVWSATTLATGEMGTIVFTVTVQPDVMGSIENSVVIDSSTPDDNLTDNSDSESTMVGTPDMATIYGHVFDDLDGDGEWDIGIEAGIPGVTVTLDGFETTTTDGDGLYYFLTDISGVHTVVETDLPGYFSTTPNEVHVEVSLGNSYEVNFGDALTTTTSANIYGTVFADLDGDGEWDADEVGIPGVTITLDGAETTTTDIYGSYSFSTTVEGVHTVVETDPAGYFSTTPNEVHVEVTLGNGYEVNFGDAPDTSSFANIYGTVFEDLDGDGEWDAGEVGLSGVTITLDGLETTTTDIYGSYSFSTTVEGVHTVVETDPAGYFSTTPNEVHVEVTLGNGYEVNFGDAPITSDFANIYGTVFADLDGDGEWDAGEVGIPDVTITLDGVETTTTDEYGSYSFSTDVEGVHMVEESDPAGYFSTTPNQVILVVNLGVGYEVNFGDAPYGSGFAAIYGTVFEDLDGDGERDLDEVGLRDVVITLDGAEMRTTDIYGRYTFSTDVEGMHTVEETDPIGYVSTTPNLVVVEVSLDNGYQVDFGDMMECTCPPDGYEEDDDPAQAGVILLGAANSQAHDFCDDDADWLMFTAEAGGTYTITTASWGQRADTFLALYDTDGETLLAANDDYEGTTDYSSRIVWQAPAAGVYYLRVTNRAGLTCCYTDYDIQVEGRSQPMIYLPIVNRDAGGGMGGSGQMPAPLGIINHYCPDEYEVDDTWELAGWILPGVGQMHSFDSNPAQYAADKDFMMFELKKGQVVSFTVVAVTNTETLLELYDEYGNALDVTGSSQVVWEAPQAGHYYLSVSPLAQAYGCAEAVSYRLVMELTVANEVYLPIVTRAGIAP